MVRIADRAIISVNGKPAIIVQSDGSPASLGLELLGSNKSVIGIFQVTKRHLIEATDNSGLRELERGQVKKSVENNRLTEKALRALKRKCRIMCADDFEIYGIDSFDDSIKYHYDIRGKHVYFRVLPMWWPDTKDLEPVLKRLTEKTARQLRASFS